MGQRKHWAGPAALLLGPVAGLGLGLLATRGADAISLALLGAPFLVLYWLPSYGWAAAAVGAVVFGRVASAYGAPSIVNFAHFPLTLVAVAMALLTRSSGTRLSRRMLAGCALLLAASLLSGLANGVGIRQGMLVWLIFAEPFLLLFAIVHVPPPGRARTILEAILLLVLAVQVPAAIAQTAAHGIGDPVRGTFLDQGAGAHVLGAMIMAGATFAVLSGTARSRTAKIAIVGLALAINVMADAKQVIGIFIVAMALVGLRNSPRRWPRYAVGLVAAIGFLNFASRYHWRLEQLTDTRLIAMGLANKFHVIPTIGAEFDAASDWVLGVGPGATVSRVAMMAHAGYGRGSRMVDALGLEPSRITSKVWAVSEASALSTTGTGSSAWAPIFSWCGIWGDLGLLGLAIFVYLGLSVWREARKLPPGSANAVRLVVLFLAMLGVVSSYLEEPGLTLVAFAWVGLVHGRSRPRVDASRAARSSGASGRVEARADRHARAAA